MSLRQELVAIDQQISAVNQQIQILRWRRSGHGNRRQRNADGCDSGFILEPCTPPSGDEISMQGERRIPTSERLVLLREELATALQRHMALQALLCVDDNGLPR